MSKIFIPFAVATMFSLNSYGQSFKDKFNTAFQDKDTITELKVLKEWEKKDPNNAELYVSYANYYLIRSMSEVVVMKPGKDGQEGYQITDSSGKTVGNITDEIFYNDTFIKKVFYYLDKGIALSPARLDIHFGKIYVLGKVKEYDQYSDEIIKTINYGQKIHNAWLWTDNIPRDSAEKFMLSSIQDYIVELYNAEVNEGNNMKRIAETVLKYYPDNVENLSNLSIAYLLNKDIDKALTPILKAVKLAPTDYVVLNNVAHVYYLKNDKPNAIKYYELVVKYADGRDKEYAIEKLAELRK